MKLSNDNTQPVLQNIELVSEGWINKYVLTYLLPNGREITYESVSRKGPESYARELKRRESGDPQSPDALCIVPRTTDGNLVLIREFRYPMNDWCVAFPAGLLEPGEGLMDCLERELREETGYQLHLIEGKPKIHPLRQAAFSSTGLTDESVQITYALVEHVGDPAPEPNEFIEVFTVPISDVTKFLAENEDAIGTRCQLILESFARDEKRAELCRP